MEAQPLEARRGYLNSVAELFAHLDKRIGEDSPITSCLSAPEALEILTATERVLNSREAWPMDILQRLRSPEDGLVERKLEGVSSENIRKTLVAFANSVPEGEEGILLIGLSDAGELKGVSNSDRLQKTIADLAKNHCYPPISLNCQVITRDGKNIVAVRVPYSNNKPHFSGQAYVRVGSRSEPASEAMFTDLVTSRTHQGRLLLKYRDQGTEIVVQRLAPWNYPYGTERTPPCKVIECNPHYAVFQMGAGTTFSLEINFISIRWDATPGSTPLVIERTTSVK